MREDRREDDLHDLIVEASERPELWNDVLTHLLELTNSHAGGLYIPLDPPPGTAHDAVVQAIPFQGYGAGVIESYNTHFHALNPAEIYREALGIGRVITETDLSALIPDGRLQDTEFFVDWARPQNFHHAMGENLLNGEAPLTLWVNRGAEAGTFGETEQQRFHRLARSVLRAVRTGERLAQARDELHALRGAMGLQGFAVLALDRSLRVRGSNALAEEALQRQDGLRLRDGRLETVDPRDAQALEKAISQVSSPLLGLAAPDAELVIHRREAKEPLKLSLTSTRGRTHLPTPFDGPVALLLLFRYERPGRRSDLATLGAHFGLSPAELRLTAALASGTALREAAARLGVSYETARSQLKSVFSKTQTRRQVELVTLLAAWHNL